MSSDPLARCAQELMLSYQRPPTYPAGRVCAHEGCDTILNVYNDLDVCGLHEPEPDWYIRDGECFAECPVCGSFRKVTKPNRGVSKCRSCLRKDALYKPVEKVYRDKR